METGSQDESLLFTEIFSCQSVPKSVFEKINSFLDTFCKYDKVKDV